MTFADKLAEYQEWVKLVQNAIASEEATKTSLILPFFQKVLGYDVFDPREFIPEHKAGFGDKPADRWIMRLCLTVNPQYLSSANTAVRR
jgi:hypothetical protein